MLNLLKQVFRFSIVGGLAFGIDYGLLFLLTEVGNMHYLVSASCSFTVATIFNYIYSMKFVFSGRSDIGKFSQFIIFVILSACGLGMNNLLMRWSVENIHIHYMLAKVVATFIVSIFNFVTRKLFLESRQWKKKFA